MSGKTDNDRFREQLIDHLRRLQQDGVWGLALAQHVELSTPHPSAASAGMDAGGRAAAPPSPVGGRDGDDAPPGPPAIDPRPQPVGGTMGDDPQSGLFGPAQLAIDTYPGDETLGAIDAEAQQCVACRLHETRNSVVFGVGSPEARLMFIGEGPGRDEDLQGEPFVGRAGKLLTKIIEAMGYARSEVYIANAVKCRPPQNRDPQADEVGSCRHFLMRQIATIRPEIIVLLGRSAVQAVLEISSPLSRLRGQFRDWNGTRVMCTYHPAYLLRNPSAKGMVWEDMKLVRDTLAASSPDD